MAKGNSTVSGKGAPAKRKMRYLIISLVLFAFVAVGLGIFFRVRIAYQKTALALSETRMGDYTWNGKFFVSADGQTALVYRSMDRTKWEEVPRVDVDLTSCGFPGRTFSYFLYNGYALCPDPDYEGLWPVSSPERFLIRDGESVWQVRAEQGRAWPVFADSEAQVPEDGGGLLAFSSDGSYALSLEKGIVTVYHTDPENDSLRVVDVKTVDLSGLGINAAFIAFTGEKHAAFSLQSGEETVYAALDCETGQAVLCPTDFSVERSAPLSRFFAQRPLTEKEKESYCCAWTNLLLGKDFLCKGSQEDLELIAVSPTGSHAAARRGDEVWILAAKRLFCLNERLNGEKILSIAFPEDNVVAVSVLKDGAPGLYCYTVLF